jgi:xanthine dehydrogenase YagS FAD-binding subunit
MAVALTALDAVIEVQGENGPREIPIADFYRLPGDEPQRDTTLEHGELITAVILPDLPMARISTYHKVRDRASYAFALVSVAAALEIRDGVIVDPRIAFGGLAHKPWRASRAEQFLRGSAATQGAFEQAAEAELVDAARLADNAFKVPMAENTLVAVLRELAAQAGA